MKDHCVEWWSTFFCIHTPGYEGDYRQVQTACRYLLCGNSHFFVQFCLRVLVYLVIHDSGQVSNEHLLLSRHPSGMNENPSSQLTLRLSLTVVSMNNSPEDDSKHHFVVRCVVLFSLFFITLEPRVEWYTTRYPLFIFLLLSSLDLSDAKVFEP